MNFKRTVTYILVIGVALMNNAFGQTPNPTVTGPGASEGIPGNTSHDYTFFATSHELAVRGYVEEEFFIEGTATRYNTPAQATGTVVDKDHPYKTRIVVRRNSSGPGRSQEPHMWIITFVKAGNLWNCATSGPLRKPDSLLHAACRP